LSIPVTEGACAGKMRIFLRILPIATSAHLHFTPGLREANNILEIRVDINRDFFNKNQKIGFFGFKSIF